MILENNLFVIHILREGFHEYSGLTLVLSQHASIAKQNTISKDENCNYLKTIPHQMTKFRLTLEKNVELRISVIANRFIKKGA